MSEECQKAEHNGCCCNCKFHAVDLEHCVTNPTLRKHVGHCSTPKGYACTVQMQETGKIFSGWSQHGLCEMFYRKVST